MTDETSLAWLAFLGVFLVLAVVDVLCLAPKKTEGAESLSTRMAIAHVLFWFCVGLAFNIAMWAAYGEHVAMIWFDGYILEYLLSMDNVFFFHVVFTAYATPPAQTYKGLFFGILGAVVLRLLFYIVGAQFFRSAFVVQFICGLVLIYSGYKTATSDDDDEDPRENRCVKLITKCLPLTDTYAEDGSLLTWAPESAPSAAPDVVGAATEAAAPAAAPEGPLKLRGTMLLLVVVVLQVIDVIFAVDSVTAKIAEHDSTFINFSSSAFAMLCLRSLYFILTKLLAYFRFLNYGVAAILVLIGVKLIVSHWMEIPSVYSLVGISVIFAVSIIVSIVLPAPEDLEYDAVAEVSDEATHEMKPKATSQNDFATSSNDHSPREFVDIEIEDFTVIGG